jgi:CheY-like chemotaxis protein
MAKEILIAASDKADQEEFQRIFETKDYRLIFSESGEEALLRVKLFKPDLIIAGSGLKEKSGFELCEDIKADQESKDIPFILLSNVFGEISDKDRRRVQADGIISKPLAEDEVLDLVEHLIEKENVKRKEKGISEGEREWESFAGMGRKNPGKKENLLLDEPEKMEEEEIIELVDMVEEPEPKMRIDDFVHEEKEEPLGEIMPFESWDRIEEMVKPEERGSLRKFKPPVTGFKLSLEEEDEVETEEMLIQLEKEISPQETSTKEGEFFEKIELE